MIDIESDGPWLTLWLDRPEARNALSDELIDALAGALAEARGDSTIRGITLRGRGGVFCAGGDLKMFNAVAQGAADQDAVEATSRRAGEAMAAIADMPQPVVALIEGAAMAGGIGLACAADIVVTTKDARYSLTETTLGIPPAQIAPWIIRRAGVAGARRIMLTAARFDGEEAGKLGIADFIVDGTGELDVAESSIRADVLRCAPQANAATKSLVSAAVSLDRAAFIEVAATEFANCLLGDEGREGIAAFVEKRKPHWHEENA